MTLQETVLRPKRKWNSAAAPPRSARGKRSARSSTGFPVVWHALAWIYAAIMVLPLYFLVVSSFKDNNAILNTPFGLPTGLNLSNFIAAWKRVHLGTGLVNSALTTLSAEVLCLALAIPASYAIARSRGRLGTVVERFFAVGLLIPAFAALVPTLLLSIFLQMFQTREFFVFFLAATALPLSVILLTQFMRAVPREMEESAMLDGAGRLRVLVNVYIPITLPGIATVAILNFLAFWNEYLFALVLIGPREDVRTAQVAVPTLVSLTNTQYGILLAGCLITMVPVYIVYIVLQRRLEDALLQGAVKG